MIFFTFTIIVFEKIKQHEKKCIKFIDQKNLSIIIKRILSMISEANTTESYHDRFR